MLKMELGLDNIFSLYVLENLNDKKQYVIVYSKQVL